MDALSRREETEILERGKKLAMIECDEAVKAFAQCASGRTFSVLWSCRGKMTEMQGCMKAYLTLERIDALKADHILHRDERKEEAIKIARNPPKKH